jgi:hypothetical protein
LYFEIYKLVFYKEQAFAVGLSEIVLLGGGGLLLHARAGRFYLAQHAKTVKYTYTKWPHNIPNYYKNTKRPLNIPNDCIMYMYQIATKYTK